MEDQGELFPLSHIFGHMGGIVYFLMNNEFSIDMSKSHPDVKTSQSS